MSEEKKDFMIKIGGKTFYCECGCNVFRKVKDSSLVDESSNPIHSILEKERYKCNACGLIYVGEK